MTPHEIRQLKTFVSSLTAATHQPWCVDASPFAPAAEFIVRVDPLRAVQDTGKLDASEVMRIPASASLNEAKGLVMERLWSGPRPGQ